MDREISRRLLRWARGEGCPREQTKFSGRGEVLTKVTEPDEPGTCGGGGNLTKEYMKLPKDQAVFQPWTGTYVPTIKLKDLDELKAFDFEFPPEKREHGFMIAFQGQTLYWNQAK